MTKSTLGDTPQRMARFVWVTLVVALALRVIVVLVFFVSSQTYSGDGPYYLKIAHETWRLGIIDNARTAVTTVGPVYPVFLIPFVHLIPDSAPVAQMLAIRLAHALFDTLTVLFVYLIARRLFGERVGRVALVAQALDLRYIFALDSIATETLFLALLTAFIALYLRAAAMRRMGDYRLAGVVLGVAILTRPVPILFPVLLLAHAWFSVERRQAVRGVVWTTGIMALVIAPWMIRTAMVTHEFVPISSSAFVHFWRTARPDGEALTTDQSLGEASQQDRPADSPYNTLVTGEDYIQAGVKHIAAQPLSWIGRVARDTAVAYLQPFGTVILTPTGAGIKQTLLNFVTGKGSLGDVLSVPGLFRRALMWLWHYWGLIGGVAGAVLAFRKRMGWAIFPLLAWVAYVTGVTAVLLIEPRYVFPTMFVFSALAAYASVRAWDWLDVHGRLPAWLMAGGV